MTDFASIGSPESSVAFPPGSISAALRQQAFKAARRHSARVKLLRRLIVVSVLMASVMLVVAVVYNPLRNIVPAVSIEGLGLDGTHITIQHPKLAGFKKDGRPYTVDAETALQDARTPNLVELHHIDAHFTSTDASVIHVVSDLGRYDSTKETMTFDHEVHLTSDAGLDARLKSAYVEFKNGIVDTKEPVTIVMNTGTVSADRMHLSDNGKVMAFEGRVHSVMIPASTATQTAGSLKGTSR